jgi:DNA adenine methylase
MKKLSNKVKTVQKKVTAQPFLKWAGGKSKLIEQYIPHLPKSFKNYYEPFVGGGALFFHLNPSSAALTDINPELINAYQCVRDNVEELILNLEAHQLRHCQDYYYQMRQCPGVTNIEKAARFIYLNKTCYNGLYRESKISGFNVPFGKYKNPKICNPALLRSASNALQNAQINVRHFEDILEQAKSCDDFVFLDPPYHPITSTSSFRAYTRQSFTQDDQIKVKHIFAELAERGVKVMLSNSDCPFIRELYKDFRINTTTAARSINSNAKKRRKISELLITCHS